MMPIVHALLDFVVGVFRSRITLQLEIVALRHQLALYHRSVRRPPIHPADRLFWAWLQCFWGRWREALILVQPETVIRWHRRGFKRLSLPETPSALV